MERWNETLLMEVKESYPSHTLRYVYHNKEELAGKIYLYNEKKGSLKRCLGKVLTKILLRFKEECQTTCLNIIKPWEPTQQLKDLEQKTWKEECSDYKGRTLRWIQPMKIILLHQRQSFSKKNRWKDRQKDDKRCILDKNPVWKISVNDFGMDLRPFLRLSQNGLHPNKSAQLTDLASRHHQKPLSDIITAANVQHKENDQSNNRKQNSPTKQNVRMNTRTEKSLIKAESWAKQQ
ncbi:hypothetical protein NWO25_07255 [Enterococcus lactis]|nr:hypothetical protein [Enterococcus lactis]